MSTAYKMIVAFAAKVYIVEIFRQAAYAQRCVVPVPRLWLRVKVVLVQQVVCIIALFDSFLSRWMTTLQRMTTPRGGSLMKRPRMPTCPN